MIIFSNEWIALLPILIIGIIIIIIMLSITYKRNHLITFIFTITSFIIAVISCFLIRHKIPIKITTLIYIDKYSLLNIILILITSIIISSYAYQWLTKYYSNKEEFYLLLNIATIGGILLSITNNLIILFIGIELISLPLFGLISYDFKYKYSLEASIKYMILSNTTSAFLLFGMALFYAETGNLTFSKLNLIISNNNIICFPIIIVSLSMILVSILFKLSLVPFQLWTPDVYQGSPIPVTAFLATTSKISIFAFLMHVFIKSLLLKNQILLIIFNIIAIISILFGNLMAISQNNIKRLLSYSSITHAGYLLLSLITLKINYNIAEITIFIYFISYLSASLGIFGIINIISFNNNENDINHYKGLYWNQPILAITLTIMILSLAGIPITLGFISKFYLIISIINAKLWWSTAIVIIGSIISLLYYLKIINILYINKPTINNKYHKQINFNLTNLFIVLCTIITLLFGIWPELLIKIIKNI